MEPCWRWEAGTRRINLKLIGEAQVHISYLPIMVNILLCTPQTPFLLTLIRAPAWPVPFLGVIDYTVGLTFAPAKERSMSRGQLSQDKPGCYGSPSEQGERNQLGGISGLSPCQQAAGEEPLIDWPSVMCEMSLHGFRAGPRSHCPFSVSWSSSLLGRMDIRSKIAMLGGLLGMSLMCVLQWRVL